MVYPLFTPKALTPSSSEFRQKFELTPLDFQRCAYMVGGYVQNNSTRMKVMLESLEELIYEFS